MMIQSLSRAIRRLVSRVNRTFEGEARGGQGLVEYALILLFAAAAAVTAVGAFGIGVENLYQRIVAGLPF